MPTLFVATIGGHLVELVDIAARLPDDYDDTRVWVTQDHAQSRSLLAEEHHVVYVPAVGTRDMGGALRSLPIAHRLLRDWDFTRVISTGSATALGYLPYFAARRVPTHYIESAARVAGPSLTGRALRAFPGIRTHTQWPHRANASWHYAGSVFDGFVGARRETDTLIRRVVVTLGTMPDFQFRRLLVALAPLLRPGGDLEKHQGSPVETLWNTGSTAVAGLDIEARPILAYAELAQAIADADVVVTHAGTGSTLMALNAGKFPLLIPRDAGRGEIGDGHQLLFAGELDGRGVARNRDADALTADDLTYAASRRVTRAGVPPRFELTRSLTGPA
jgi:UDP-N-acetylglucosamine transferase subunit ALG13